MDLPLHGGSAPKWLFQRMVNLSGAIAEAVVDEHGKEEFLRRIADPLWFQAFSCALGFDWHSSGTTTVTCGALRCGLERANVGIRLSGGKGIHSKEAIGGISSAADDGFLSSSVADRLVRSSRLSAKVDSAAVQDGHRLYHHAIVYDDHGNWSVVQQGMCDRTGYARRYHWSSLSLSSFVNEPHTGIVGTRVADVLDMTDSICESARRSSVDLVAEPRPKVEGLMRSAALGCQSSLLEFGSQEHEFRFRSYAMPKQIDWNALARCYEFRPQNYEELLLIRGVGTNIVRALALISQLVYGDRLSWDDPVKFSFAVGGKDGVPFPVDRKAMDAATEMLSDAVRQSSLGEFDRKNALRRLSAHGFL
ncbi:MAG: DUF763 domain-containing protein [Thermoplasmata archaeon]